MSRTIWLLVLLLTNLGSAARAGAWMREPGDVFVSFGTDLGASGAVTTVFAEAGLRPRLTLGLDGWRSYSGDWSALAVANMPVRHTVGAAVAAVSVAAGVARTGDKVGPQTRLGLHVGYGFDAGWLTSDVTATYRLTDHKTGAKLTGTWGLNVTRTCATILETRAETGAAAVLAPSVACRFGKRMRLRMGGAFPVTSGGGEAVLGLQSWLEF